MVYFKTRGSADGVFPPTIFASIITRVHSPECVNLVQFGDTGLRFETSVMKGTLPGQWDWMPFQKDQQARLGYSAPDKPNTGSDSQSAAA